MKKFTELRSRIRGPVFPVPVPFNEQEDVDYQALESYVTYLVSHGAPVIIATVGTSRYNLLTEEEMLEVNRVIARAAGDKAISVAAGPGPMSGSTRQNIYFAEKAKEAGADAIMLLYPERWYGDDPVVSFFHEVCDAVDIGVMVHAVPMRDGFGGVDAKKYMGTLLLDRITQKDNVVGIKEENANRSIYEDILHQLNSRVPVIGAGGAMHRFINDIRLGAYTYLVGVGSFRPDMAVAFYQAAVERDEKKALDIARQFEEPYFDIAVSLGWHRALKETLALYELMPPYERAPMNRIDLSDREKLKDALQTLGWRRQQETETYVHA